MIPHDSRAFGPRATTVSETRKNRATTYDNFDARGETELSEELLAIRPRQTESPHIGYPEALVPIIQVTPAA